MLLLLPCFSFLQLFFPFADSAPISAVSVSAAAALSADSTPAFPFPADAFPFADSASLSANADFPSAAYVDPAAAVTSPSWSATFSYIISDLLVTSLLYGPQWLLQPWLHLMAALRTARVSHFFQFQITSHLKNKKKRTWCYVTDNWLTYGLAVISGAHLWSSQPWYRLRRRRSRDHMGQNVPFRATGTEGKQFS